MNDTNITLTVIVNIANLLGLIYNIPQMLHTYRIKSTGDISPLSVKLRILTSTIWIVYSIYLDLWDVLVSWTITFISAVFTGYYMWFYKKEEIEKEMVEISSEEDEIEKEVTMAINV